MSIYIDFLIMALVLMSYIGALIQKDLIKCVVLTGLGGLGLAYLFSSLLAPDVARITSYNVCYTKLLRDVEPMSVT